MKIEDNIVKLNIALTKDHYALLKEQADNDYLKVATKAKQILIRFLLKEDDKREVNTNPLNEQRMGN